MTKLILKYFSSYLFIVASLLLGLNTASAGSLYLPLQLAPEIESRIERVMLLANMPIIKRPIPVKRVYDALDKIKGKYPSLVNSVDIYLSRYEATSGLTHASLTLSTSQQNDQAQPLSLANQRGQTLDSNVNVALSGFWAVNDFMAVNIGGLYRDNTLADDHSRTTTNQACENRRQALRVQAEPPEHLPNCYLDNTFYEGTFVSVGWDFAQLDIGYRPHWFGPLQDSSMLISTEAAALPSVTLSNVMPFDNLLGLQYEIFYAQMSESFGIRPAVGSDERINGNPKLFGVHLSFSPIEGFSISANRLMQYGGGTRDESINSMFQAFVNAREFDNVGSRGLNFGNQLSSISTRYTFTGRLPVSLYATWAGEDSSKPSEVHLGNSAISWGIHLPLLPNNLDVTIEGNEWQNAWYVNGIYSDGLTNEASVIGHWGGNRRAFGEQGGAESLTAKVIWETPNGWQWTNQYRQLENNTEFSSVDYSTSREFQSKLSIPWREWIVGAELLVGNDVFGDSYSQISGFIRW